MFSRRRLLALRVRLRRIYPPLRFGAFPLHGFALFNHNQETLFCSDYSGLRPIYAAQPHPKTLLPRLCHFIRHNCHARALARLTRAGVVRPAPPVRPLLVAASRLRRMVRGRAWSSPVHNRLLASESSLCGQATIRSCRSRLPSHSHSPSLARSRLIDSMRELRMSVAERRNPLQATELLLSRGSARPPRATPPPFIRSFRNEHNLKVLRLTSLNFRAYARGANLV